jgi:peptidoglycan/LPS O-acetylase OafA/YrhL
MRHRREIDGLRAVAVVPVVLFHAGFPAFAGGFVGVDVFFVISGYLITGLLIGELGQGSFSLARFYERRARRILPALFLVMLCTIPFALLWMLPPALKDFSQSLAAAGTSTSNVLFWLESGYFGPVASEKPLLHTWSLGVEEQYYLVFPLFLMLIWGLGRRRVFCVLAAIALASLALSQWAAHDAPSANFFLAPTRAWELFAGSLCALWQFERPQRSNGALAALGLGLVLAAVFAFDEATPFPSLYALVPVGGTALVILFAGPGTGTARLLSARAVAGIGLISYSVYLWHQPLFAFARIRSIQAPGTPLLLVLTALSFALAYFSWKYVEQPFRRGTASLLPSRRALFGASGAGIAALVLLGLLGHAGDGLPGRIPAAAYHSVAAAADRDDRAAECLPPPEGFDVAAAFERCADGVGGSFRVALLGDSHADVFAQGLRSALGEVGISFVQLTADSCPPFPDLVADTKDCRDYFSATFPALEHHGIDVVVIAARWTAYAVNSRFDNGEGGVETGPMHPFAVAGTPASAAAYTPRLMQVFVDGVRRYLAAGYKVVLVYPTPEAGWNVPATLSKLALFERKAEVSLSTDYRLFLARNRPVMDAFDGIDDPGLFRVRPDEVLCNVIDRDRCTNAAEGEIYYYDDDHLSNTGANLVVPSIVRRIQAIRRTMAESDASLAAPGPSRPKRTY